MSKAASTGSTNPVVAVGMGVFALATSLYVYHKRQQRFVPPVAKRVEHKVEIGSHTHKDDLYWIRDDERKAPPVIRLLEKENVYSAAMMEHTTGLQDKLYKEYLSHLKEDDSEVPYKHGPYQYYRVTTKGLNYPRYCRKLAVDGAKTIANNSNPEQTVLDVNALAAGQVFCSVVGVSPSPDHNLLAYAIDTNGYEQYEIRVVNLKTGALLPDSIPNASGNFCWSDNNTLYYTTLDPVHRPYRVHRHALGTAVSSDPIVFEEKDEKFWVGLGRSLSGEYIFIDTSSKVTGEVHYLSTEQEQKGAAKFQLFQERKQDVLYSLDHTAGYFWISTNEEAKNFKLCRTPTSQPEKKNWSTVIAHDPKKKIDSFDCFRNHVVVYGRENGFSHVQILSLKHADDAKQPFQPHALKFPEQIFTCEPGRNRDYDSPFVRVVYESYVTPDSTFDVDLQTGQMKLAKELEVPLYDRSLYASELVHARAADGTAIPISMVYRKDKRTAAGTPQHMLLFGYGSYGLSYDPQFDAKRLSLLDRGLIVATAHIRGGGEMGRLWYEDGKMLKKKNTFNDFIAAAEHLIQQKVTEPAKLAISGGSAGGLLMGAVINARPDLFKCVLTRVPFVDVMVTMNDPSIPLTVTEYEEWGNPADEQFYEYMLSYSPIDNVKAQAYPAMLVTTGLNDSRVAYWEPVKWVQKLRAHKTDSNPILLKCEMIQGHGGSSARYAYLQEAAYNNAFVLDQLGFKK